MFAMILWQQNLAMGGGPVTPVATTAPTVFLTNNAQRNTLATGAAQQKVGLTGDAGANG